MSSPVGHCPDPKAVAQLFLLAGKGVLESHDDFGICRVVTFGGMALKIFFDHVRQLAVRNTLRSARGMVRPRHVRCARGRHPDARSHARLRPMTLRDANPVTLPYDEAAHRVQAASNIEVDAELPREFGSRSREFGSEHWSGPSPKSIWEISSCAWPAPLISRGFMSHNTGIGRSGGIEFAPWMTPEKGPSRA